MDTPITPFDLQRMLFGVQPPLFYLEILVRTLIMYGYALLMIRWIGKRGIGQMSMVEFVLIIALGPAVGDTMFYPEVPMLYGMLVITIVIGANKLLNVAIVKSDRAKDLIDGRPVELVRDGRLNLAGLASCSMGAAETKAMLRRAGVRNLGNVSRAYLECGGGLSVFPGDAPRPGLRLIPPDAVISGHRDMPLSPVGRSPGRGEDGACCLYCGIVVDGGGSREDASCEACGTSRWVAPLLDDPAREGI